MNYDLNELEKFSKQAAHWWDPEGDLKTLHDINPVRLCYISNKINLKDKKVIDVGCGGGLLAEGMATQGAEVTGIDLSKPLIEVAKLHLLESNLPIEYLLTSVEALAAERPQQYDILTCLEMLEHVPDPAAIIRACAQLVKPGGHLFFSTINRTARAYAKAIIAAEYILKILPQHTHDYAKFIRPAELSQWAREAGLIPQALDGMAYHPFTRQASLSRDLSVNYLLHCTRAQSS